METGYHRGHNGTGCCANWWGDLTPIQRMWLHSHLWDLEVLEGWTSDTLLKAVESHHNQRVLRYSPDYTNGALDAA